MHPGGVYSLDDARLQSPPREISWHDAPRSESRYAMIADGRVAKADRDEIEHP
jgi:hypothetical protein